jgi:S-adenosylmethionine:tRNA ribosyltransferase-isomerase
VHRAFITLHVGAGTFQPVRTEAVGAHVMHAEFVEVDPAACEAIAGRACSRRASSRRGHDGGEGARECGRHRCARSVRG